MTSKDKQFIAEVYDLVNKIEALITSYEYQDRVMSSMVIGVLDVDLDSEPVEGEEVQLKSVFSHNLQSSEELDIMKEIMTKQFEYEDEDLNDILGDLGISLN